MTDNIVIPKKVFFELSHEARTEILRGLEQAGMKQTIRLRYPDTPPANSSTESICEMIDILISHPVNSEERETWRDQIHTWLSHQAKDFCSEFDEVNKKLFELIKEDFETATFIFTAYNGTENPPNERFKLSADEVKSIKFANPHAIAGYPTTLSLTIPEWLILSRQEEKFDEFMKNIEHKGVFPSMKKSNSWITLATSIELVGALIGPDDQGRRLFDKMIKFDADLLLMKSSLHNMKFNKNSLPSFRHVFEMMEFIDPTCTAIIAKNINRKAFAEANMEPDSRARWETLILNHRVASDEKTKRNTSAP